MTELETHVSDRDDLVEQLKDEVISSRRTIRKLEHDVEQQEMAARAPELVLSGGSVPPPPRPGGAPPGRPPADPADRSAAAGGRGPEGRGL